MDARRRGDPRRHCFVAHGDDDGGDGGGARDYCTVLGMGDWKELVARAGLDEKRAALVAKMPCDDAAKKAGRDRDTVLRAMIKMRETQAPHGSGPAAGSPIPQNIPLLYPNGDSAGKLGDFVLPGKPLVLNFGSCS